jgi:hypothetical protein
MGKKQKWVMPAVILALVAVIGYVTYPQWKSIIPTGTVETQIPPSGNVDSQCSFQPAITYAGYDAYASGTAVKGTNQIKVDGKTPVTTYANGGAGQNIEYWLSNSSWHCKPASESVPCNPLTIQNKCYGNGTATVTLYDTTYTEISSAAAGANNLSLATSSTANAIVKYIGTALKSNAPFGGLMVVEFPNTISSVTVSGAGNIVAGNNGYTLTYSDATSTHTHLLYTYDGTLDDGTGTEKIINLQFKNGASSVTGDTFTVCFYDANYYLTNAGGFVLDTQQALNQLTTKTGLSIICKTGYFD